MPILYGTVVGHIVLTRSKSLWSAIIRYGLVFLSLPICLVMLQQFLFGHVEDPVKGRIVLAVCIITLFLALRRWYKPESPDSHVLPRGASVNASHWLRRSRTSCHAE